MTYEPRELFEKLVAALPELQLKLKDQLHGLIKVQSLHMTEEVEAVFLHTINGVHSSSKQTPLIIPWRGKYLMINYDLFTDWENHAQKNLGLLLMTQIVKNVLLEWENDHLERLIYQDDLTNVFNYRRLCEDLEVQLSHDRIFTLAFFDIDDLKKINELHGHYVGSRMIKDMAKKLSHELGKSYQLYRYGGDEFVCLFDQLIADDVAKALQKVIVALEKVPFVTDSGEKIPMGVSVGLAEFPRDGRTMKEIIELADKMMYHAKKSGKTKVIQASMHKKAA